ncbi:HET domain-containing protein [Fusarium sp. LHS14.1]|nr:HET domain-containing protein [Fusarium sp. LHS14.1]
MVESTAREPMKLEEDPASQQYDLKLYDQRWEAGVKIASSSSLLENAAWNSLDFRFNACSKTPRFYASEVTLKETYRYTQFQIFTELSQPGPEPIIGAARSIAAESNSSQCFDLIRH